MRTSNAIYSEITARRPATITCPVKQSQRQSKGVQSSPTKREGSRIAFWGLLTQNAREQLVKREFPVLFRDVPHISKLVLSQKGENGETVSC